MSEPKNNFVEMIEVWKSSPNAYPVAVIIYDSDGGKTIEFHFDRTNFLKRSNR